MGLFLCEVGFRKGGVAKMKKGRSFNDLPLCGLWVNTEELQKRIQTFPVPGKISKYLRKISD